MNYPEYGPRCECGEYECQSAGTRLPRAAWEVAGGAASATLLAVAPGHQLDREVITDRGTWLIVADDEDDE